MIKLPAYFDGYGSRKDGSFSVRFSTQELPAEYVSEFARNLNAFGWLVFAPSATEIEIPKEHIEDDSKSLSDRLRAVMYVYFQQNVKEGDFDVWRKQRMEKIINSYKDKLV